jgi:flagellin-like protein
MFFNAYFDWKYFPDEKYVVYKQTFQIDKCRKTCRGGAKKRMKFSKLLRSKKALSPIFAVLILIAIAVIAGIVVYMFTSGTIATMTGGGTAGQEKVAVETVDATTVTTLQVWAKSTGGTLVTIDGAIIKDSGGATLAVIPLTTTVDLPAAGTLTAVPVANTVVAAGNVYTVTLTSEAGGSFVSSAFKP